MKKLLLFITTALIGIFGLLAPATSVFAITCPDGKQAYTDSNGIEKCGKCVDTSILGSGGQMCDDGTGSSVIDILTIVLNVMTIGIGIIGAIGITIVGIQYMTAGDNEEQVRKSKRRMFEIVIGFAAYILIYALLQWLLPAFKGV